MDRVNYNTSSAVRKNCIFFLKHLTGVANGVIIYVIKKSVYFMYNIETLSKISGLSRRAVRYYIQRGLLEPPEGTKRGCYYTEKHLDRIHEIQRLSEQGVPLLKIKEAFDGVSGDVVQKMAPPAVSQVTRWERIDFGCGVELGYRPNALNSFDVERIRNFIEGIVCKK